MNSFLQNFCAGSGLEYLKVDEHWRIQEISDGVQRFVIAPDTLQLGQDIRQFLPELIEYELDLMSVLAQETPHFQLKKISRLVLNQPPIYFDLWAIASPASPEGDRPNQWVMFLEDVTESILRAEQIIKQDKQINFLLKKVETDLVSINQVIDFLGVPLLITDYEGTIIKANHAAEKILKFPKNELSNHYKNISEIITDRQILSYLNYHYISEDQDSLTYVETICRQKTGEEIYLAFSCVLINPNLKNIKQTYIYIGRELGNRKQMEAAMLQNETQYRLIVENTNDLISRRNPEGIYLFISDSCRNFLGYEPEEMIGHSVEEFWHPDDEVPLPTGNNSLVRHRLRCQDGSYVWVETSRRIVRDPMNPEQMEILAISRDISEYVAAEIQLQELNETLETKVAERTAALEEVNMQFLEEIVERNRVEKTLRTSEKRLRRQSNALLELTKHRTRIGGDLHLAIREISEVAVRTLEIERASVWFYNEDRSAIVCFDLYEQSSDRHSSDMEIAVSDYPQYFQALGADRILAVNEAQTDPRIQEFATNYLIPLEITSRLDAPIRLAGRIVGVVCAEHIGTARQWALEEENFAGSLADFVALAIEESERKRAEAELQKANEELERRVQERTAALQDSNHHLRIEIQERQQATEALRIAEAKYRSIFENVTEGIFQTSPDGQFLSANPALARILGYSTPEELMKNVTDIKHQLYIDPNRRDEFIQAIAASGAVADFESLVYSTGGNVMWISENARAVYSDSGHLLYYEGTVQDITTRKIVGEALRYQREESEQLLLNILPKPIAERLKLNEDTIAESFPEATVMFADIVGFTQLSARISPKQLVDLLNKIFSLFDQLADKHGLEKIKTIGDAYMVVGGLPTLRPDHAEAIANMALDMQIAVANFNNKFNLEMAEPLRIRIGINTGPVVAGVIGLKKFIYDLWGDTVNTASR
jgi:PAS domain S-box-containing protein